MAVAIYVAVSIYVAVAVAVPVPVAVAVAVTIAVYVAVYIASAVDYFHFRNNGAETLNTGITVNIIASVYVTYVNVTKYLIILISIISGVGDGGGDGWYIWLTMLILP